MKTAGFDWDNGNLPKCGKHGVTQTEIEEVLLNTPAVMPDPHPEEPRMRAIGKTSAGRYVFFGIHGSPIQRSIFSKTHQRTLYASKGNRPL